MPTSIVRSWKIGLVLKESAQFSNASRELLDERVELREITVGQIAVEAADANVVGVHARAARRLLEIEDVLAQVEAIKENRDRPEIDAVGSQPYAVRRNARQLGGENAHGLRAGRNAIGDAEQLLDA